MQNQSSTPFILSTISVFVVLVLAVILTDKKITNLQTQIDELKIIVDQKFLPAMIFDKYNLEVR